MIDKVRIIRMSPANYSASKCRKKSLRETGIHLDNTREEIMRFCPN